MTKLLDKPLKAFTIYAFLVLLCSIPVYFFMVDRIWIHEVNEHNLIVSESTKQNLIRLKLSNAELDTATQLWNKLTPETKLQEEKQLRSDSSYTVYRNNTYLPEKGYDRYHGLVTYFKLNDRIYSLTVETNIEESYETIADITFLTVVFFIILLLGFVKLNKRISAKLWRPFYSTLEKMKAFDLNKEQHISFEITDVNEFEEMNNSINKLVSSNVAVFRQQKEFTENASHELQTPLAIVQAKLDLLVQDAFLTESQSAIIEDTQKALSRISRINKNLLLLAKIENQQFMDKELITMSEPINDILNLLSGLLDEKTINLKVLQDVQVESNKIMVEILLTNLMMNAVRYSGPNAEINMILADGQLSVSNIGSESLNASKLFKRFSTAAYQTPGSGLGLSIVKQICSRYGWEILYDYLNQQHTFTIIFNP
ncbi:sensor histidine kinase [Pedobacter sp. PWIIR3]